MIAIVGHGSCEKDLCSSFSNNIVDNVDISNINEYNNLDFVLFTGGEDINPSLYGHKNVKSYYNSERDDKEIKVYNYCIENNIPMVGICRGSQLLNVMNGGVMIQDVTNHSSPHNVSTSDSRNIIFNSCHHQMSYVTEDTDVLAWTKEKLSKHYLGDQQFEVEKEPEAFYMEKIKSIGFQYHPEWMNPSSDGALFFIETVKKILNFKNKKIFVKEFITK